MIAQPRRALIGIDRAIGYLTEIPAALLVVAEVAILLAGVICRYGLNRPLIWSDELAKALFLWLSMLGAVIALRRGEHMRMTTFVTRLSSAWQARLSGFGMLAVAGFALLLLMPAIGYVASQNPIVTPEMGMHDSWRVLALVVALALMVVLAVLRLIERTSLRDAVVCVLAAAVLGGILYGATGALNAIGTASLLVFFVGMVGAAVLIGVPIAYAFGISTLCYLTFATSVPVSVVLGQMDQGMSNTELLAVPLFVLLGLLLEMTGIAAAIVNFFASLVGHLRGGLSYVLFGAMFLISGISGSKAADQAAVAPILFPEMRKRGAHPGELVAQLAAAGAMSETIPPSLVLIIIGSVTGTSIAALFAGGIGPAVLAAVALIVVAFFRSRADKPTVGRASAGTIGRAFLIAIPGLILPFVIRTVVLEGIATATEVSTVGVAYAVVIGLLVYRKFDGKRIGPILVETASLSGAILLIIGAATAMAWSLTQAGFAQALASAMTSVPGGRMGFVAVSLVLFIVLGSILEGVPALVLFGPLLFPIARGLGVNEVHYTMVVILAMGIGLFAPPFGVGFYQSCLIGRTDADAAIGRIFPYLAAVFVALVLVAAIPAITLVLVPPELRH